jgi:hypothetical protein
MHATMAGVGADPQPTKLSVDPQTYNATQLGEVFPINITVTSVHNLTGVEFKLGYNTTLLDVTPSIVPGPLLLDPYFDFPPKINETEGYVWVFIRCLPSDGNGTVATITFNATYAGSASCALHLYDTELVDNNVEPIYHEVEDGEYNFIIASITVATNKPSYNLGENVTIQGNLTQNGFPSQGLVAIEVENPSNQTMVARTLQTGSTTPPGDITVVEVFPSDNVGNPKDSFSKGSVAYFTMSIRNDGTEWEYVRVTINAYDGNTVPLPGVPSARVSVAPGIHEKMFIAPILIQTWAATGNGSVYACAFTDWPHASGVPYCQEKNATFEITGSGEGSNSFPHSSGNDGNYSLTFKLPKINPGNYTVYVSSSYRGTTTSTQVASNTAFDTVLLGDINGNGRIDGGDVGKLDLIYSGVL